MAEITWRRATAADLPRIVAIYNQAVANGIATDDDHQQTVANRRDWFNSFNNHHPLWVIEKNDQVVGWVGLPAFWPHPNYSQSVEISLYIDNQFQHQHIGTATLNFIDQQAPRLGIQTIVAYIYERNHHSQQLFKKHGYHYAGELTNISRIHGEFRSLETYLKNF